MDKYEISERSADRAIQFMRDRLRAPLEYSWEKRGYYYADKSYEFPRVRFTEKEILGLIVPGYRFQGLACLTPFFMTLGFLVNEGKLEWDKPIRHYLPGFKMVDNYATQHMSARDLLRHSIGLPKKDRVWKRYIGTKKTRRDFMKEFSAIQPASSFRDNMIYQNVG